ncbi:MAG: hypothetical protein MUD01_06495 [Chloroflexaceae bacterium]|jgi:hypothetical protein|nr:hypothetical protein [Chloroflexaceae bacterium]
MNLRKISMIVALLPLLASMVGSAQAQGGQRCFSETGQCISGPIRAYWERNGGLAVFGFPITAQREELTENRSIQVQWFERDRIEIQANGSITAGRLGARYLELQGINWQELPKDERANPGCRYFPETGFNLCEPFLSYWNRNGGLERFGYPITNPRDETIEGGRYPVQYFERRRMEYHAENVGTPFTLLLGLLGREIERATVCPAAPSENLQRAVRAYLPVMDCPNAAMRANLPVAWQRYERGWMFWIGATASAPPLIFVLQDVPGDNFAAWQSYTDSYREGESIGGDTPAGKIAPVRGFGKLWWGNQPLRDALGWPVQVEQSGSGSALFFGTRRGGGWMYEYPGDNIVVMQPDGRAFGVRANILPR